MENSILNFHFVFQNPSLSVNLTTMLVMTTIFISKMEGLPPTSDIKMIDIWLILCQMVPFAEVILLTAMEYNREDKKKGKKKKSGKKTKKLQNASLTVIRVEEEIVSNEHERGGLCPNCGIPSLKTLGKNQFSQETIYTLPPLCLSLSIQVLGVSQAGGQKQLSFSMMS